MQNQNTTNLTPNGLMPDLLQVFEKYKVLKGKRVVCLFDSINGQVNVAMRDIPRQYELQDRLKEWLDDLGA
jgi:hypothetical protein